MKTAEAVKAQLKHRAKKDGRNVQDLLTLYVLERVLYRLSASPYCEYFTLKGGILLYGLFNEQFPRATVDIDLLGSRISNEAEQIRDVFVKILNMEYDDAIRFASETLTVRNITENKKYHGVRVAVTALMDRTRIPVSIDIGFGDVIYPGRQKMEYPTILNDTPPVLYCYSLESVIAEKLEAIVSLGSVNSRYKDFYDIYVLAEQFDFDSSALAEAVKETFGHRGTTLDSIVAFEDGFADDPYRKGRWNGFVKSKHVLLALSLEETIAGIKTFLMPVINSIREDCPMNATWKHEMKSWNQTISVSQCPRV